MIKLSLGGKAWKPSTRIKNVNTRRGRKIGLVLTAAPAVSSSLFHHTSVPCCRFTITHCWLSSASTLARTHPRTPASSAAAASSVTPEPPRLSGPSPFPSFFRPSSPTLTLRVIQSSQGDGYPSPRSAYALHFLKRLIRLIDCPTPLLPHPYPHHHSDHLPRPSPGGGWCGGTGSNQVCIDISFFFCRETGYEFESTYCHLHSNETSFATQ